MRSETRPPCKAFQAVIAIVAIVALVLCMAPSVALAGNCCGQIASQAVFAPQSFAVQRVQRVQPQAVIVQQAPQRVIVQQQRADNSFQTQGGAGIFGLRPQSVNGDLRSVRVGPFGRIRQVDFR